MLRSNLDRVAVEASFKASGPRLSLLKGDGQVLLYSLVGVIGGMAYDPFYDTNENLFSKLWPGIAFLQ